MPLTFDRQPVLTECPPSLAELAGQYERPDVLVIGEKHISTHREYLLSQIIGLQKLGYNKLFIEQPVTINPELDHLKRTGSYPYNNGNGSLKPLILGLHELGMEVRAVDMIRDGSFQRDSSKTEQADLIVQTVSDKKDADMHVLAQEAQLPHGEYINLVRDTDIAAHFGEQSLANMNRKYRLDKDRLTASISQHKRELHKANDILIEFASRYDFKRNAFMCDRLNNALKSEKAIMLVGSAHTAISDGTLKTGQTVQAMLDEKYGISTLTVNLNGAVAQSIHSEALQWIDKSEIDMRVAKILTKTKIEICACVNDMADKYFVVNNYKDDDLDEPDIQIHLPQQVVNYR